MMDRKENFERFLAHEPHDHVPCNADRCGTGGQLELFENGPLSGGPDDFGCVWAVTKSANGQGVPVPGQVPLPDVTEWKKYVKFPDPSKYDWQEQADKQLPNFNPATQLQHYSCWNGPFLRLMHLMGFDNGLLALAMEPEACSELIGAIVDYRISTIDYIEKYFKPDFITIFDDIASTANLFMSPSTYTEIIAPHHKRWAEAVRAHGAIPSFHICGHCESIIPMLPDLGFEMWEICEPTNDVNALQKQLGDRLAFFGGYPMNGIYAYTNPTEEELRQSMRDTLDLYGPAGSYGMFGYILYDDPARQAATAKILTDEAVKYGTNYYIDGRAEQAAVGPLAGLHDIWHRD